MSSNGWKRFILNDALEALIDYRGKTPQKTSSGIPLITAKIIKGGLVQEPTEFIAEENYSSWMKRGIPKVGDVVLTVEAPLGEVAQLRDSKVALAQRIVTLRGKKGVLDNGYLKYFLQSDIGQARLKERETGTTVTGIKQSELRLIEIDAPDYFAQRRIASILSSLDEKIDLNLQTNQTLEAVAQALFKEWFVEFNFPGATGEMQESELGKIPKEWKVGNVGEMFELQRGFDLPASNRTDGKFPVIAASGVNGCHHEYKIKAPGVTTGRSGVLGNVFYIQDDFWPLNTSLFIKEFKSATPLFSFFVLQSLDLKSMNGGSAVPTLNRNEVHKIKVGIPQRKTIQHFEEKVVSIFQLIKNNEEQAQTLIELRDTLLPKFMKGEIFITETEKLAAAV